jgi:uncharacterized membrane protein HdeD (DUF308 family)
MSQVMNVLAAALARHWWVLLLRGMLAIVFALLAWLLPGITLTALVLAFGIYVEVDGVLGVWMALASRKSNPHWWWLLLWGLAGIVVGAITFAMPGITALVLLMYIAAWALVTGVMQVMAAWRLRKEISGEWLLGLGGLLSILFGALMVWNPGAGALAVLWLIGVYAFIFGLVMVMLALRARRFAS